MNLFHNKTACRHSAIEITTTKLAVKVLDVSVNEKLELTPSLLDIVLNPEGTLKFYCKTCGCEVPLDELCMKCNNCGDYTSVLEAYFVEDSYLFLDKKCHTYMADQLQQAGVERKHGPMVLKV